MNQGIYFGQLVIGPAGSGKSTFCKHMQQMAQTLRRKIIIVNLDPAAQHNEYKCDIDIKQLITLDDVMQQMQLGPNGGLLFTIQYLLQNQQWLIKQLDQVVRQDDYVIFDCPGQIQLFSDQSLFRQIVKILQQYGFSLISMYMIDVNFIGDNNKYASGILQALSAQIALQLPSITVLTKCDLIQNQQNLQKYLNYFTTNQEIVEQIIQKQDKQIINGQNNGNGHGHGYNNNNMNMNMNMNKNNRNDEMLPNAIRKILNQNSLVSIRALNLQDQDSVRNLLWEADNAIQYGENLQPDQKAFDQAQQHLNQ